MAIDTDINCCLFWFWKKALTNNAIDTAANDPSKALSKFINVISLE